MSRKLTKNKKVDPVLVFSKELNLKQEKFCQLFTSPDSDFFGNGTQSYIEAYEPKQVGNWYNSARADASRMLTRDNVCKRINELLETGGFNDENVDKQHMFLLNQFADLKSKLGAIKEYNALKQRVVSKQVNLNVDVNVDSSLKELTEIIKKNIRYGDNTGKSKSGNGVGADDLVEEARDQE